MMVRAWTIVVAALIVFELMLISTAIFAHDRLIHTAMSPEMKSWFDGLQSGQGPCCSDADGTVLSDLDWDMQEGHFRVRIKDKWFDVPDSAVLTVPNKAHVAMAWPYTAEGGEVYIRCFIPGEMS